MRCPTRFGWLVWFLAAWCVGATACERSGRPTAAESKQQIVLEDLVRRINAAMGGASVGSVPEMRELVAALPTELRQAEASGAARALHWPTDRGFDPQVSGLYASLFGTESPPTNGRVLVTLGMLMACCDDEGVAGQGWRLLGEMRHAMMDALPARSRFFAAVGPASDKLKADIGAAESGMFAEYGMDPVFGMRWAQEEVGTGSGRRLPQRERLAMLIEAGTKSRQTGADGVRPGVWAVWLAHSGTSPSEKTRGAVEAALGAKSVTDARLGILAIDRLATCPEKIACWRMALARPETAVTEAAVRRLSLNRPCPTELGALAREISEDLAAPMRKRMAVTYLWCVLEDRADAFNRFDEQHRSAYGQEERDLADEVREGLKARGVQ